MRGEAWTTDCGQRLRGRKAATSQVSNSRISKASGAREQGRRAAHPDEKTRPPHACALGPLWPAHPDPAPGRARALAPPPPLRAHRLEPASVKDCRAHAAGLVHWRPGARRASHPQLLSRGQAWKPASGRLTPGLPGELLSRAGIGCASGARDRKSVV